jgi:hypothetical protein
MRVVQVKVFVGVEEGIPLTHNQWIPFTKISLALFWKCYNAVVLLASSDPSLLTVGASLWDLVM